MSRDSGYFSQLVVTGAHLDSIAAVASGNADVCSVDCVTFALCKKYAPDCVEGVKVIARGPAAPGLPLITSISNDDRTLEDLRRALNAFVEDTSSIEVRNAALWTGVSQLNAMEYNAAIAACA